MDLTVCRERREYLREREIEARRGKQQVDARQGLLKAQPSRLGKRSSQDSIRSHCRTKHCNASGWLPCKQIEYPEKYQRRWLNFWTTQQPSQPLAPVLSSGSCARRLEHMVAVDESSSNLPNRCGSRGSQLMEARRKLPETKNGSVDRVIWSGCPRFWARA